RLIREEEPPRPSTRLSTTEELSSIAASRGTEPRKLCGLVRGELDWIVMKCLEKDRNRRYETANGLAMDLRRYLADEPVQACPPSAGYRFRKFARRHRAALSTAVLVGVLLVVGTAVAWYFAIQARERAREADANAAAAKANASKAIENAHAANAQKAIAQERGEELRRQDYVNRIALALREVQDDNVPLAEDLLQGCPVDLRGWEWHYVNRLAHLERLTFWGHRQYLMSPRFGQSVQCLAFSPDGTWIASGAGHTFGQSRATATAEIRLWDPATGPARRTLGGLPATAQ